ncbi:MAG: ABC transporter ATP-binding protein [Clostridia bacterium]|nr:ABC transporter ATP-binding protein [Clostridia bacterium]
MITIRNLTKKFQDKLVLNNLNLTIEPGDIYGFLGKNGAGKTTTLNIITNLIEKDSGEIVKPEGLKIGYLPESPQFYDYMTGYEYLYFLTALEKKDKEKVLQLLELVDLKTHMKKPIKFYSRGMQQRLGIAAALIHDPDLVLLDEPTSALDPQGRVAVMNLIQKLSQQGKTILFSTHILSDVERICTRVGILSEGVLIIEDKINAVMTDVLQYKILTEQHEILKEILEENKNFEVTHYEPPYLIVKPIGIFDVFKTLASFPVEIKELIHVKPSLEDIFVKVVK